jgi:hypothetical protein
VSLEPFVSQLGCEALAEVYGTLDYSFVVPEQHTLYIADWKFGKGIEVYPDTEQLKAYALGRLAQLTQLQISKIFLVIGQPRLYSGELFKTYETTPNDLVRWMQHELVPALNNAESKHPTFCPTEKGCMWCLLKTTCKYRKDLAMKAAADVFAIHAKLPHKTDEEEIAEFLQKLPDLKKYIADIELYVINSLKAGKYIPGFKLVAGRSIRQWVNEEEAKKYYFNQNKYDLEDLTITKFKSPTQIEKLIGKKNLTEEDLKLVHKPEGAPTMVSEADARPALDFKSAAEIFEKFVN